MSQCHAITGHCPGAGGKNVLLVGGELPRQGAPVGLESSEAACPSLLESVCTLGDGSEDGGAVAIVRWGGEPTALETAAGRWFLTQRGQWIQRVVVEPETAADGVGPFTIRRDWRHRWRLQRAD